MSDFVVPDMTEPIVGWRGWQVQFDGLHSLHGNGVWPMKERMEAVCNGTEPTAHYFVGWEALPPHGNPVWVRDVVDGEQLQHSPLPGYLGPVSSVAYYATNVMHVEPLPERPSDLVLPQGWKWRIGHRQAIYPPRHTECPGDGCSCGLYAAKTREVAESYGGNVIGEVYLWGKVTEGANGYRAQYAYPKELHTRNKSSERMRAVLLEYDVPVNRKHTPASGQAPMPRRWWEWWKSVGVVNSEEAP